MHRRRTLVRPRNRALTQIQSPKMRRRSQKFNPHPLPFIPRFSQIYDPAFLLFQRFRVNQHQHFTFVHFLFQQQQPAMRVHHLRLAGFRELAAAVAAAFHLHPHLMKHARAAPGRGFQCEAHTLMLEPLGRGVNCPPGQVFHNHNAMAPAVACASSPAIIEL
jgi:hypothetical protein